MADISPNGALVRLREFVYAVTEDPWSGSRPLVLRPDGRAVEFDLGLMAADILIVMAHVAELEGDKAHG